MAVYLSLTFYNKFMNSMQKSNSNSMQHLR